MSSPKIPRTCEICTEPFLAQSGQIKLGNGRFCSRACANASRSRPMIERFWLLVNKDGPTQAHRLDLGQCWIWTGHVSDGYGVIANEQGKLLRAHRAAWMIHYGAIPDGMNVCHRCDNRTCVRFTHLFTGTDADNMHDCMTKGRNVLPPRSSGEHATMAKFTNDQVRDIRRMAGDGMHWREIAKLYTVVPNTIWCIVRRKTYADVS